MKKYKKLIIVAMLLILISIPLCTFAIDMSPYENIYQAPGGIESLNSIGGKILGIIQVIGMGISVIMIIVIGMKYMIASVEEKAKLKETLIPYLIGAILLFGGSNILSIVVRFSKEMK